VLEVLVRLEQGLARKELDEDAPDGPDVARVGPPEAEDDLGRTIVARRDDRRVVLLIERGRAEVDEADLSRAQLLDWLALQESGRRSSGLTLFVLRRLVLYLRCPRSWCRRRR